MSRYDKYSEDALRVLLKTQELTLGRDKPESGPQELASALLLSALPDIVAIATANNVSVDEKRLKQLNDQQASQSAAGQSAGPTNLAAASQAGERSVRLSPEFRMVLDQAEALAGSQRVEPFHLIQAAWPVIQDGIAPYFRPVSAPDLQIEAADIQLPRLGDQEELGEAEQILLRFGRELTGGDRHYPFFGREAELDRVIATLLKFWKPNPLLIGDSGVGKSAMAEGLANRINQGRVPPMLRNARLFEIRLGDIIAGTNLHGALEENLNLLVSAAESLPNSILFIDEIHQVVPAFANNAMSEILKPALSAGRIRCIGATTGADYSRYLEKDSALLRRFQTILIKEPDRPTVLRILRGVQPRLEEHYGLRIGQDSLERCLDLAGRYLPMRRFPDKALDILDRAAARSLFAGLNELGEEAMDEAVREVANVVTSIGVARHQALPGIEANLGREVYGQAQAIDQVASAVRVAKLRLHPEDGRPDGAFLFTGPTGVGKTALALSLARELSGRDDALFRIDMSEFSDAHTAARLLGAPPGYIGYEDSPLLTRAVDTCAGGVLLLDELEKAHPQVHRLFLQVLDAGRATDASGRNLSFAGITIIATCNVGNDGGPALGFAGRQAASARVPLSDLKRVFPVELLNRFDAIIPFRALNREDCRHIITSITIPASNRNLEAVHGLRLDYSQACIERLLDEGFSEDFGARHLQRAFRSQVLTPLAARLSQEPMSGRWRIDCKDGMSVFSPLDRPETGTAQERPEAGRAHPLGKAEHQGRPQRNQAGGD